MGKNAPPHRRFKARRGAVTKQVICLCCERKKLRMVKNPKTGIFEGKRICRHCLRGDRFKFIGGMNGD